MEIQDYPGSMQAADKASVTAQKHHIRFIRISLIASITAAMIAIFNYQNVEPKLYAYIISAVLLFITASISLFLNFNNYEAFWYQGRAMAESIKTLTWRYITGAENFEVTLSDSIAETTFIESIKDIEKLFHDLIPILNPELLVSPTFTNEMRSIRSSPYLERLRYYVMHRIYEQKKWYIEKSKYNNKKRIVWFWLIIACHISALTASIILILNPTSNWNLVGLLTTMGASCLAWTELKQHKPLVQAYNTAANELAKIESLSTTITTEQEFIRYVLDSENAISREHTVWLAQKRK